MRFPLRSAATTLAASANGVEVRKPNLGVGWRVPDESLAVGHEQLACLSKEEVAIGGGDGERDAA